MDEKKTFQLVVGAIFVMAGAVACSAAAPAPAALPTAAPAPLAAAATPTTVRVSSPSPAATTAPAPSAVPSFAIVAAPLQPKIFPPGLQIKRRVSINAPAQTVGGAKHEVDVNALNLPTEIPVLPAKGTNTVKLLTVIMEPEVRTKDTNQIVTTFDSPLAITVDFTAEDSRAVNKGADGKPLISLITYYRDGNVWKWERLKTTVTCVAPCETGTLSAQITNLRPNDPVSDGTP